MLLLNANVLIALVVERHVHHDAAERWFGKPDHYATCPITQGSLLRMLIRGGQRVDDARAVLDSVVDNERHVFWPDDVAYHSVPMPSVIGHGQVTDAYLAQLARSNKGAVATFDRGFAASHRDVAELLPTEV